MIFKKEKTRVLFLLYTQILLAVTLMTSCGRSAAEFASKEELARSVIDVINRGDKKALISLIVGKTEYIKKIYPHLPEGKQSNALSGEDFYRIFFGLQKINAVDSKIKLYKEKIISVKSVGDPEKTIKTDAFTVLRKIPVTLAVKDGTGNKIEVTDNQILGVVIEKDGKYKLLNMLR